MREFVSLIVCLFARNSGVTPMSSAGLEPGAPRRSDFQGGGGGRPDLTRSGALFVQLTFRILLLN